MSVTYSRHRSNCCINYKDMQIFGDYEAGTLYRLDMDTYTDGGYAIRRIRSAQHINVERLNIIFNSLELEFEAGTGTAVELNGASALVALKWSDNSGVSWSGNHPASIGKTGEYKNRSLWRRLGITRDRVFHITITEPIKIVILAAYADVEKLAA